MNRKSIVTIIYVTAFLMATSLCGYAQDDVYMGGADAYSVYNIEGQDTISVFGNMENNATGYTALGGYVYMFAPHWKNTNTASFTNFKINSPNANPADGAMYDFDASFISSPFLIEGGYNHNAFSGPTFPNVRLNNSNNILLDYSDFSVLNRIVMVDGFVFMNNSVPTSTLIGGGKLFPEVQNYSRDRFFVCGGSPVINLSYFYFRDIPSDYDGIFPIGTSTDDYTPAAIKNKSISFTTYRARVFDGVFSQGNAGSDLTTNPEYIKKTWVIHTPTVFDASFDLYLQHNLKNENVDFTDRRDDTYITRLIPETNEWENWNSLTVNPYTLASYVPDVGDETGLEYYHYRNYVELPTSSSSDGTYYTKKYGLKGNPDGVGGYVNIYPVPTQTTLHVVSTRHISSIGVYDDDERLIIKMDVKGAYNADIDVRHLATGWYSARIFFENAVKQHVRFLKL